MPMIRNLVCPKCHRFWATMDFSEYPNLKARHVKIVAGSNGKLRDGQDLRCSLCGYSYTTWDIVLAGASPENDNLQPGEESKI